MNKTLVPVLIVGAGPFGLAVAAYARRYGIEHIVVGKMMDTWKSHMPAEMLLRSNCEWHYDPFDEDTITSYLQTRQLTPSDVEPLALDFYLGYAEWFRRRKQIEIEPTRVVELNLAADSSPYFETLLHDGNLIRARSVVLALGLRYFMNIPSDLAGIFPPGRFKHTFECVDFTQMQGKRVLIIGGRQSAFEWAALSAEHGADRVYIVYRHPTPFFETADWSWIKPMVDSTISNPGWYRSLSREEKDEINRRMWAEGRLKLEPWLASRIQRENIESFPETRVVSCNETNSGELEVALNDGSSLKVDDIVLATGYKVNVDQIPFLAKGNILPQLRTLDRYPVLDESLQSSVAGLYFTSMAAVQDFGPFFGFTVAAPVSAVLIGRHLGQQEIKST